MTKETQAQADARAERLVAALRSNLRKRKGLGDRADPFEDQHPATNADPFEDQHPVTNADPFEDRHPASTQPPAESGETD